MKCGKPLTGDEIGLHKKMIHRGATSFMCLPCLANFFNCEQMLLQEKIKQFRAAGCMLFSADDKNTSK